MYGVLLKDGKRSTDLIFKLDLNKTKDQLAMANSVRWYGYVLRKALDFEVEGQSKKGGRAHGKGRLMKKVSRLA